MIGSKSGSCAVSSHDKLLYLASCLIGLSVEVQVKSGSVYAGIFHATSDEKDFGMLIDFLLVKSICFSFLFVDWYCFLCKCFM